MRGFFVHLAGAVAIAGGALPLGAQGNDAQASKLVRAMAEALRAEAPLPGLSVAVSRNGSAIFAEGFGYADTEQRRPVTPLTRSRTGSVGKVITVTGLARLLQEARVNVDAPVQQYVPSFPVKAWPVTARELAGHLAGMPHYNDADSIKPRFYPSVTDGLSVFAHESLLSKPNTQYHYSTHGFTLLSAVIEGAAKQPFLEYMQHAVFDPLGMRSTAPDMRANPSSELATYYELRDHALVRVEHPEDPSYKWAGGGLTSTPSDLLHLADGYFNGFLDTATVSMLWTSHRLESGRETGVGLAWRNGMDIDGRRVLEHAGSMEGARSVLSIFPDERIAISLMTNREWSSTIEETAHMLALPFLTAPRPTPQPHGMFRVTVETVNGSGEKKSLPGTLVLTNGRGTLAVDPGSADKEKYELFYLSVDDVYALVRPDGIYRTTIGVVDGVLLGRAIAYGSPRLSSPANNPPFLTFAGRVRP